MPSTACEFRVGERVANLADRTGVVAFVDNTYLYVLWDFESDGHPRQIRRDSYTINTLRSIERRHVMMIRPQCQECKEETDHSTEHQTGPPLRWFWCRQGHKTVFSTTQMTWCASCEEWYYGDHYLCPDCL